MGGREAERGELLRAAIAHTASREGKREGDKGEGQGNEAIDDSLTLKREDGDGNTRELISVSSIFY